MRKNRTHRGYKKKKCDLMINRKIIIIMMVMLKMMFS